MKFLSIVSLCCLHAMIASFLTPAALGWQIDTEYRSPRDIDGSKLQQPRDNQSLSEDEATESLSSESASATNARNSKQVFDALFRELDNMVPGEFESGSPQKKAVQDAVKAFQDKDIDKLKKILEEQSAADKNFPPQDLMLAALSYSIRDSRSGLALLEKAAIESPDYPGVYSAFARLALNQGRISDALAQFEKCQRVLKDANLDQEAHDHFARECLDGMIDVAMQQKRYDDAREKITLQREKYPDNPKVLSVSAELEFLEGDIDKSLEYLNLLNREFPNSRVPEFILATWSVREGKTEDTEKWIKQAAEKYPGKSDVQLEYANWAIRQNEFAAARAAIIKAEKEEGETLRSRNLKARIAFAQAAYGVAEAHYQYIASQKPNDFDAANMLALSLAESGDDTKQKRALDIAVRNFQQMQNNVIAQAALGYIYLKNGDTDRAQAVLTRVVRTPGTAPEIDYFLASLLAELGQTQQAKMVLESTLKREGLFLYRTPAKKLLLRLEKASESLPEPEK